jgi:hypothetical protein
VVMPEVLPGLLDEAVLIAVPVPQVYGFMPYPNIRMAAAW